MMGNFFRGGTSTIQRVMRAVPRVGQVDESHGVFRDRAMFEPFPDNTKSAIFGMGCFWGVERLFWNQNPAVYSTQVGYAGGAKPNPTYEETCQKNVKDQHAEVVRVIYWPDKISVSTFFLAVGKYNNHNGYLLDKTYYYYACFQF